MTTPSREPRPIAAVTAGRVLARALRLVCPRCGGAPLYAGPFRMHEACAACGFRYERAPGYFVGAIYVNYAVTAAVALGTVFLADALLGLSLAWQIALGIALGALVPLLFFRYSRSLWLSLEYLVWRADERRDRLRRRTP